MEIDQKLDLSPAEHEDVGPTPQAEYRYSFNQFAVDWPYNGPEEALANEIADQTLAELNATGKVDYFLVDDEAEDVRNALRWFENEGYFILSEPSDDRTRTIEVTDKWLKLFFRQRRAK